MKLVASAAALLLVGLSSIWLWQDAVTQTADPTPGVIITTQSAEREITVAEGPGGGDVLGMAILGMELGGTGATDPASGATATDPDQLPVTEAWARLGAASLAWKQAGADTVAQAGVRAEESAAAEESATAESQAERETEAQAEREAEAAAAAQAA